MSFPRSCRSENIENEPDILIPNLIGNPVTLIISAVSLDSGAVEQDADSVLLIFRPSYYNKDESDSLEIDIAKQRNGQTNTIEGLSFNRGIGRIGEHVQHTSGNIQNVRQECTIEALF